MPGNYIRTKEIRKKISEANKGQKRSEETKRKMSKAHMGKKFPEEWRENMSRARRGMKFSKKHRESLSKAFKGKRAGENNSFYGKHHTKETIQKLREHPNTGHYSGKKHHLWKGGISRYAKKIYKGDGYVAWRVKVFERDEFICQNCGFDKGNLLNAHHLVTFSFCLKNGLMKLIYNTDNGVTLCKNCHKKIHSGELKVKKEWIRNTLKRYIKPC